MSKSSKVFHDKKKKKKKKKKKGLLGPLVELGGGLLGLQLQKPTRESEAKGEEVQERDRSVGKREREALGLGADEQSLLSRRRRRSAAGQRVPSWDSQLPLSIKKEKKAQEQRPDSGPEPAEGKVKKKRLRKSRQAEKQQ